MVAILFWFKSIILNFLPFMTYLFSIVLKGHINPFLYPSSKYIFARRDLFSFQTYILREKMIQLMNGNSFEVPKFMHTLS